ncbi:SANT associated [Artemisia annua]|uniref:SANT associated n=1 Tax=Artemisia annua TaxID=35608 RepID=A0A2U1NQ99_ARTAN|nr:SANT associated [Artemisia annua]
MSSNKMTPISYYRKSVVLHEWWLIKAEGAAKLGVGGFTNRETLGPQGMRLFGSASTGKRYNLKTNENRIQVFGSAEISKRLDNNTLEAQDGIMITIIGVINRSRTLSNGFSPEVCNRFTSGFPYNWEEFGAKSSKRSFPVSFDDVPVPRVHDLLMSSTEESESCALTSIIVRDILKQCSEESYNQSASVDSHEKVSTMIAETQLYQKQSTVSSLNSTSKIIREAPEIQSCQVEDGGFMSNATHEKNVEEAQAKECSITRRLTRSQTKI